MQMKETGKGKWYGHEGENSLARGSYILCCGMHSEIYRQVCLKSRMRKWLQCSQLILHGKQLVLAHTWRTYL